MGVKVYSLCIYDGRDCWRMRQHCDVLFFVFVFCLFFQPGDWSVDAGDGYEEEEEEEEGLEEEELDEDLEEEEEEVGLGLQHQLVYSHHLISMFPLLVYTHTHRKRQLTWQMRTMKRRKRKKRRMMRDNPILSSSWQQLMSFFLDSCDYYNLCIHVLTLASSVHTLIIHSNFNTPRADIFYFTCGQAVG